MNIEKESGGENGKQNKKKKLEKEKNNLCKPAGRMCRNDLGRKDNNSIKSSEMCVEREREKIHRAAQGIRSAVWGCARRVSIRQTHGGARLCGKDCWIPSRTPMD